MNNFVVLIYLHEGIYLCNENFSNLDIAFTSANYFSLGCMMVEKLMSGLATLRFLLVSLSLRLSNTHTKTLVQILSVHILFNAL